VKQERLPGTALVLFGPEGGVGGEIPDSTEWKSHIYRELQLLPLPKNLLLLVLLIRVNTSKHQVSLSSV